MRSTGSILPRQPSSRTSFVVYAPSASGSSPSGALPSPSASTSKRSCRRISSNARRSVRSACGALRRVLEERLGARLPRPILIRIHTTASGNPLFALELAAALQRHGGRLSPGESLPTASTLDDLLLKRLDTLSAPAVAVATTVAALADPTVPLVASAVGRQSEAGLAEAFAAHILTVDGERIAFTHPLLAWAASARLTPRRRASLHARLARLAPTTEERARHLALATAQPDRAIASVLEEAAATARSRGVPATAAELAEEALRLTPPTDVGDAGRRLFLAATSHDVAGDPVRAISLLERARSHAPSGVDLAAVLIALADVEDDPRASVPLYRQALGEVEGDHALEAAIHIRLAGSMAWSGGAEQGAAHAERAVRAASKTDDVEIRCRALAARGDWNFRAGLGISRDQMTEATKLERSLAAWPIDRGPTDLLSRQLVWTCDFERARRLLHELRDSHTANGDPDGQATASWWLAFLEWRAGNWDDAEAYAAESYDLRLQLGNAMPVDGFPNAILAAHRGRIDEARAAADRALTQAEAMDIRIAVSNSAWMLGFVELSLGNATAALPHLRRSYELRNDFMLEPAQRLELGDLLEALVAVGKLQEADELLAAWQPRADTLDRAWARAILARTRALLDAERGDLDRSYASFEKALAEHERCTDPFHQARTVLALGRVERRARRRKAARTALEDALARFEGLGATLWADQARTELARIGGRKPTAPGALTPTEQRVVALAADGLANKEIAATLFVSVHTVEVHLSHAYRKLGVRSRGQLARTLAASGIDLKV